MRATICLPIAGVDVYAEVDFHCAYRGFPGDREDPPEAPEFGIDAFTLYLDHANHKKEPKELPCPAWLQEAIIESDAGFDALCEAYRESKTWGDD